jgi:hypothetical protein
VGRAEEDPLERLRLTKAHMDALKRSPEPVAMRLLFDIFGRTPKLVSDIPSSMLSSKASVVMTNVAGSPHTLYVAGVPIERVMFWVPHPGENLGMGISILSYRGYATLAIVADAHLVPDPETITQRFQQEFVTMLSAARRAEGRRTGAGTWRARAEARGGFAERLPAPTLRFSSCPMRASSARSSTCATSPEGRAWLSRAWA